MYKFKLYTHSWDLYFKSWTSKLPDDEFIKGKNEDGEVFYMNRNQILFYKVWKIEDENLSNSKESDESNRPN